MFLLIKAIILEESKCTECEKELPRGYEGYIGQHMHYMDYSKYSGDILCEQCKNKTIGVLEELPTKE